MINPQTISSHLLILLENLANANHLMQSDYEILKSNLLEDHDSCQVFNINAQNVEAVVKRRSQILQAIFPKVLEAQAKSQISLAPNPVHNLVHALWYVWIPLAMQLAARYQGQTIIQGILGGQGTGKTTMTKFIKLILAEIGYECVHLSLDDLYKTYAEREQIKKLDPEIQWRGVPSTHDLQLGLDTLAQLCSDRSSWQIPRFDKSAYAGAGDRTDPEIIFTKPQIILFEGWFVGVCPVEPNVINSHKFSSASDQQFVLKMNAKLQDYLPLWQKLDSLWLLFPEDYRLSLKWRQEAEQQLTTGMSNAEITKFVHYFWRSLPPEIFIEPLQHSVDLVITLNSDHYVRSLCKGAQESLT